MRSPANVRWRVAILASVLWTGAVFAASSSPSEQAHRILRDGAHPFCTDAARWPRPEEIEHCDYLRGNTTCPAFAQACDEASNRASGCARRLEWIGRACSCASPGNAASGIAARVVLALVVLLLLVLITRWVIAARKERAFGVPAQGRSTAPQDDPAVVDVAAPAAELFARAMEAMASGAAERALYLFHAALLQRLAESGDVRLDPSHTLGDYVRQTRGRPSSDVFRMVAREVERVRFGGAAVTRERVEYIRNAVAPWIQRAMVVVLTLGLLGASAACNRVAGTTEAGADAQDVFGALLTGARAAHPANVDFAIGTETVYWFSRAPRAFDDDAWAALTRWVERGGTAVLVAGTEPDAWAVQEVPRQTRDGRLTFEAAAGGRGARTHEWDLQLSLPAGWTLLATYTADHAPWAASRAMGRGKVVLLASDVLFSNAAMAVDGNPEAIDGFVGAIANGHAIAWVRDVAERPESPLRALHRARLLVFVLHLIALAVLAALWKGRHFASPREPARLGGRSFVEHAESVGDALHRTNDATALLSAFAPYALERLRRRGYEGDSLVEVVCARTGQSPAVVRTLLRRAESQSPADASPTDLQVVAALRQWLRLLGA